MDDFDRIYTEYFPGVYKFVLSICQNPTLAEEVTQETFYKALKKIDQFKGNSSLNTWLCTIAKNTLYSYIKKQSRYSDCLSDDLIANENIEENFEKKEAAYTAHSALHRLGEPYKEVFWLRAFGELSFAQIAALFEKTESWARVTYYRAKTMIKEELR